MSSNIKTEKCGTVMSLKDFQDSERIAVKIYTATPAGFVVRTRGLGNWGWKGVVS